MTSYSFTTNLSGIVEKGTKDAKITNQLGEHFGKILKALYLFPLFLFCSCIKGQVKHLSDFALGRVHLLHLNENEIVLALLLRHIKYYNISFCHI